jgi:hypothetical protein
MAILKSNKAILVLFYILWTSCWLNASGDKRNAKDSWHRELPQQESWWIVKSTRWSKYMVGRRVSEEDKKKLWKKLTPDYYLFYCKKTGNKNVKNDNQIVITINLDI